jgi:hypothetical protein
MKSFLSGLAFALIALTTPMTPALADDTGFAGIHSMVRTGGRLCFVDHSHSGQRSRQAAEAMAVRSWASFTATEYGSDWASIHKAIKRRMACSQSSNGWSCDLDATPCK